jgi:hypothetical protein
MRKLIPVAVAACALACAATAGAALAPGVYDPGNTGCVTSTYSNGVLHLAKNCATTTIASAGADITGLTGQTFQSASFTLASASQCQGGSPRFNVTTSNGLFFLGCNNVTPTTNADGTATYTFTPATLAAAGQQVPTPTGTISGVSVLIDVQGTADLSTSPSTDSSRSRSPRIRAAAVATASRLSANRAAGSRLRTRRSRTRVSASHTWRTTSTRRSHHRRSRARRP